MHHKLSETAAFPAALKVGTRMRELTQAIGELRILPLPTKTEKTSVRRDDMDVSKNRGGPPKWMVKIMVENPIKNGWDLGVALFLETPIYLNGPNGSVSCTVTHLQRWTDRFSGLYIFRVKFDDFPLRWTSKTFGTTTDRYLYLCVGIRLSKIWDGLIFCKVLHPIKTCIFLLSFLRFN